MTHLLVRRLTCNVAEFPNSIRSQLQIFFTFFNRVICDKKYYVGCNNLNCQVTIPCCHNWRKEFQTMCMREPRLPSRVSVGWIMLADSSRLIIGHNTDAAVGKSPTSTKWAGQCIDTLYSDTPAAVHAWIAV